MDSFTPVGPPPPYQLATQLPEPINPEAPPQEIDPLVLEEIILGENPSRGLRMSIETHLPNTQLRAELLRLLDVIEQPPTQPSSRQARRNCLYWMREQFIKLFTLISSPELLSVILNILANDSRLPQIQQIHSASCISLGVSASATSVFQLCQFKQKVIGLYRLLKSPSLNIQQQHTFLVELRWCLYSLSQMLAGAGALALGTDSLLDDDNLQKNFSLQLVGFSLVLSSELLTILQSSISLWHNCKLSKQLSSLQIDLETIQLIENFSENESVNVLLAHISNQQDDGVFHTAQPLLLLISQGFLGIASMIYINSILSLPETQSNETTNQGNSNHLVPAITGSIGTIAALMLPYINHCLKSSHRSLVRGASPPVRLMQRCWQRLWGTSNIQEVTDTFVLEEMAQGRAPSTSSSLSINRDSESDRESPPQSRSSSPPPYSPATVQISASQVSSGFSPQGRGQLNG